MQAVARMKISNTDKQGGQSRWNLETTWMVDEGEGQSREDPSFELRGFGEDAIIGPHWDLEDISQTNEQF